MPSLTAVPLDHRADASYMRVTDVGQILRYLDGIRDHTPDGDAAVRVHDADLALAARIREGDWDAFRSAFTAHYDALHRFAMYHTRSPDVAEDLVQDVFAAIWNHRASLTITSSLRAYLTRAVRNRVLNAARHQASEQHASENARAEGVSFAMGVQAPAPDMAQEEAELRQRMVEAMASLPARQREVMLLRWRDEMRPREIADALGISEQVVRRQLTAAAEKLRRVFVREDFRR